MEINKKNIIIIGGGMGGLFTGAFLSKEGYHVTVLEKNAQIGGGLQNFTRKGENYETGMHILGGLHPGGAVRRILSYLGIWDRLKLFDLGQDATDIVMYGHDRSVYYIPKGRQAFVDYFSSLFPNESEGIKQYVDKLFELSEEVDLFHLRPSSRNMYDHSEMFLWPADQLIAHFVQDKKLRDLLAYLTLTYGGAEGHTMAYVHALINVLYIQGTTQFIGGSQQLADQLSMVIRAGGGEIRRNEPVVSIQTQDGRVTSVTTRSKKVYMADIFISAVHPSILLELLPEGIFTPAYRRRVETRTSTYSAFTAYIKFKPNTFPQLKNPVFYQSEVGLAWNRATYDCEQWPQTFMAMTPPKHKNETFASHMIVIVPFDYELLRPWEDTTVRNRGEVYDEKKEEHLTRVINRLKEIYPVIDDCIVDCFASTPLTIRDYFGNKEGALYGYMKDCQQPAASQLSIRTRLDNLLLTGQNVNLHGMCGVPLTALETAETIVGKDTILRKI